MTRFVLFTVIILVLFSCSTTVVYKAPVYEDGKIPLFEMPEDMRSDAKMRETINFYSRYLKGRRIFVDPGHGGRDRKNRSGTGLVVEADVNLRVALFLKDFLTEAGAQVFLSRDQDVTVELTTRARLANDSKAEVFLSIHHNAAAFMKGINNTTADPNDNWTNFTSIFYHSKKGDYEFNPSSRDFARYVQRDLSYAVRNSSGPDSFDGTYSDYDVYDHEGFSVLSNTNTTSILVECGFHTSNMEEQRLRNELFNKIQAWGIFRGIARYFAAGVPNIEFMRDFCYYHKNRLTLVLKLSDPSGIDENSIVAYWNRKQVSISYNESVSLVTIILENATYGDHELKIFCANKNGNHSFPFIQKVNLDPLRENPVVLP